MGQAIEKLEHLPYREPFRRARQIRFWMSRDGEYHSVNHYHPYKHAERILKHYVGKSVDEAFTHYCSIVPKYQQKFFWAEFNPPRRWRKRRDWYVDDKGNIQNDSLKKEYKGPYYFKSKDYETELRHKVTGHPMWKFNKYEMDGITILEWGSVYPLAPIHKRYTATKDDFGNTIISGTIQTFASKNDPRYQRLYHNQRRDKAVVARWNKEYQKNRAYSFLTKEEQAKKDSRALDLTKRDSHGFDENSFKGEPYHGQKRKKK